MCIVQDFPVGSCRYGCFESDRCFRCKFIANCKVAFTLAVVNESTNELIQIGGGIGRGIVNTEYIFFVNNIILEKTRAGEKVCIQGFGVYTPRLQTSRLARNPKSGETLMLIPRTIVHFKCAPNLLKEINK